MKQSFKYLQRLSRPSVSAYGHQNRKIKKEIEDDAIFMWKLSRDPCDDMALAV